MGGPRQAATNSHAGGVAGEPHLASTKRLIMREPTMQSQQFSPADYSPDPTSYTPDEALST
jgi:hypothetical protein